MKTDTPEQKQLQDLIAEYQNTGDAIETHKAEIEQLKQTIAAAESDSTTDLDTIARTVVDGKREIEVLQFKVESLTKRKVSLRTETELRIKDAELAHNNAVKAARAVDREKADTYVESKEFQQFLMKLKGLYELRGYYSWDTLLSDLMPSNVSNRESLEAAEQFWKLEPKPSEPPEIREAKNLIEESVALWGFHHGR